MNQRQHTVTAMVLALTGLLLIRLGFPELQPWDEALYAIRGQASVVFDAWLDPTPYTAGGLYSSTPPPVTSWLVGSSIKLLGPTEFAVRLPITLCAAGVLALFIGIVRRFLDATTSLLCAVALAGSMPFMVYARSAMSEIPLILFFLLAIEAILQMDERKGAWPPYVLFATALAGALLTKMTVSLLPVVFLVPRLSSSLRSPVQVLKMVVSVTAGVALAAPWYWHMVSLYGDQFLLALAVPHATTIVEGNTSDLGLLYYVNSLIAGQPLTILAFVFLPLALRSRQLLPDQKHQAALLLLIWFVVAVPVLSFAPTKNPHYSTMLIVPAIGVAAWALQQFRLTSMRMLVFAYGLIAGALVWAVVPGFRTAVKSHPFDPLSLIGVLGILCLIVCPVLMPLAVRSRLAVLGWRPVVWGAALATLVATTAQIQAGRKETTIGAKRIAERLMDIEPRTFVYLFHGRNAGDAFAPQLAWYMTGRMTGWLPGFDYTPEMLPEYSTSRLVDAIALRGRTAYVVYMHVGQKPEVVDSVMASMSIRYGVDTQTAHYILFRRY
jgi:4-amino-4-deoxy-L-arabinose transferase-like glycosyltransferase